MTLTLRHYPPDKDNVRAGIEVVLAGSYDVDVQFPSPPRILDLGAHVGSFSVWAASRWPGAKITAFEPHPMSAAFAKLNTDGLGVEVLDVAVVGSGEPRHVQLFEGKDNTGQRSLHQLGEQRTDSCTVRAIPASSLPPCEILKMDTEGCELENLRAYKHLKDVHVLMLEWHRQDDYRALLTWLPTYGFELVRDDAKGRWISDRNLIFVRRQPRSTVVPVEDESEVVFRCPRSSLDMIAELHGYDLGTLPDLHAPVILDVGAHVGGFAWYALKRWPGARALCFEPHPTTLGMLRANTKGLPVDARHSAVVWPLKAPTVRLYEGVHGRHECSLRGDIVWGPDKTDPKPHVSQKLDTWVDVPAVDASELPPCDVLKIDCEGGELEVLGGYKHLKGVKVLITEAHAVGGDVQGQAAAIRMAAESAGLRWIGPDPIIARFVR